MVVDGSGSMIQSSAALGPFDISFVRIKMPELKKTDIKQMPLREVIKHSHFLSLYLTVY